MAFVALFTYAVLIGGGYGGINIVSLRLISLALIATGLLLWALLAWRRRELRPCTAIWPALVLPLAAVTLALVRSPNPRLGLEYLAWGILLVALYLLLVRILATPYARDRIGGMAASLSLVASGAYIGLVVSKWLEWWGLLGYLTPPMLRPNYIGLPIGGPTHVAPALVLLAAIAIAGLGIGTPARRIVIALVVTVTGVALLLTGTRASWLGAAVALGLVGLAFAIRERRRVIALIASPRLRRAALLVAVVAIPLAVILAPAVLGRLASGGDGGRGYYAATAMRMFEEAPLTGQGPGNWTAQRIAFTRSGEPDIYVPNAHNLYVQTLGELGLAGAVAGVIAIGAVLWLVMGGLRDSATDRQRWGWVSLFVLVYLGVHGIFDAYTNIPAMYLLASVPVALLDATSPRRLGLGVRSQPPVTTRLGSLAGGLLLIATVLAVFVLLRVETVALTHARAVAAIDQGEWAVAEPDASAAASDDRGLPPYLVTRGLAAAGLADWTAAETAFAEASRIDDLPWNWMNLALTYLELDREDEAAVEAIQRAMRVGYQHPTLGYVAGTLYDRMGMADLADAAYVTTLRQVPSLASDPSWTGDPERAERFQRLLETAVSQAPEIAWELALMSGDPERAMALTADASEPGLARLVISAWTGDSGAFAALRERAIDTPGHDALVAWTARLAARNQDADDAKRFRAIAAFGNDSGSAIGYEVRVRGTADEPIPGQLPLGHKWGQDSYRRPTPGWLLAAGLPALVLVDPADKSIPDDGGPNG